MKAVKQKQGRIWEETEMEELWKAKIHGCWRAQRGNGDRWWCMSKSTAKCSLVTLLHSRYIRNINTAVNKELPVLNTCIKLDLNLVNSSCSLKKGMSCSRCNTSNYDITK
jgi:hypothetical protein